MVRLTSQVEVTLRQLLFLGTLIASYFFSCGAREVGLPASRFFCSRSRLGRGCGGVVSRRFSSSSRCCSSSLGVLMASRNRGKIKIKLRDLARLKPTEEEEEAQRQQLIGANIPTGVAILGASLIENMLDELLTSHFSRQIGRAHV